MYFDLPKVDPRVTQALVQVLVECVQESHSSNLPHLAKKLHRKAEHVSRLPSHQLDSEQLELLHTLCKSVASLS